MNLQVYYSSMEETLSIRIDFKGLPFLLEIGFPFSDFINYFAHGSSKVVQFIHPLQIVEDQQRLTINSTQQKQEEEEEQLQQLKLLTAVKEGLLNYDPELCEEGVNGTYFLKDKEGKMIGVFKPIDEEGSSSPKKSEDASPFISNGIKEGEGALREVAAYLLDKDHFSGVPQTFITTIEDFYGANGKSDLKAGSLQEFVNNDGCAEDIGPGVFPSHEVHKIGVLDLRICNNDRHAGNILYKKTPQGYKLIPIDHGLSLSSSLQRTWFDWLTWPQAKQPFDEETKKYIQEIDVEADSLILQKLGLDLNAIKTMKISSTLLKKGTAAGLTLYDIGSIASRNILEEPSQLEIMLEKAEEEINSKVDEKLYLTTLWKIMDEEISKLACK